MLLLEGLSVSFFNLLLTLKDMPGILERVSTAFNLETKPFGEHIYVFETPSPAAEKRNKQKSHCIINVAAESPFVYILLTQTSIMF